MVNLGTHCGAPFTGPWDGIFPGLASTCPGTARPGPGPVRDGRRVRPGAAIPGISFVKNRHQLGLDSAILSRT